MSTNSFSVDLMKVTSQNTVRGKRVSLFNLYQYKCRQIICVPFGNMRKSNTSACGVYVLLTVCFTVCPPK